ncbi:hypothetical protein JK364_49045 [Streptomyces sp. 110]|uniref:Transcriptional regulator n=1 Tax=Streptomyces endocoffeicus TaxID=2898945 RepID=A0ABS1Q687_9ACTN|nr:hypothetical protein [Streptomyces endocoffeicus]MBL1120188.1 hypothetical protein [Streptomyces endocoffeicus]
MAVSIPRDERGIEQGWRPLPSDAHFARYVRAEALRRGMADLASAAFLASRETVGRPAGERLTDASTERLLTSLRMRFGQFRSLSASYSTRADDPVSLMMAGRSAEAEQLLTERPADAGDALAWILLSNGALCQGHLETADRAARKEVRGECDCQNSVPSGSVDRDGRTALGRIAANMLGTRK